MGTSFEKDWQHIAKTVCLSKTSFGSETLWNLMYPLSSQGMAFWTNSNHIKVLLKILKINNKILVDFFFTFSVLSLRFWYSLTFQENLFLNYSFHALQSLMFHILTIFDYNMSRYLILLKSFFSICRKWRFFWIYYFLFLSTPFQWWRPSTWNSFSFSNLVIHFL